MIELKWRIDSQRYLSVGDGSIIMVVMSKQTLYRWRRHPIEGLIFQKVGRYGSSHIKLGKDYAHV